MTFQPTSKRALANALIKRKKRLTQSRFISCINNQPNYFATAVSPVKLSEGNSLPANSGVSKVGLIRPASTPNDTEVRTYLVSPASREKLNVFSVSVELAARY